jgi:UDP-N-acetylmuramoylalanine--D-glutamate ligase
MNKALQLLNQHLSLNKTSNVLVVGLGITGLSVAKYLHKLGFKFSVIDSRENPPNAAELKALSPEIQLTAGTFQSKDFEKVTHLIVSPGISLNEAMIQSAVKRGAKIVGEMDLFACATDKPIIAITGSNGKSTVTTMVGEMGKLAGKITAVGGNLGTPALDLLADNIELYVLELSSFQLERTHVLNAAAATVLNITADHLDRHADMSDYAAQKQKVFRGDGVMVLNLDDEYVAAMQDASRQQFFFSIQTAADFYIASKNTQEWLAAKRPDRFLKPVRSENSEETYFMPCADLPLEGRHNQANALAALALGTAVGLDKEAMCSTLKNFAGLSHRMQKVAVKNGVTWVNDSKATNIGACIAALEGYNKKVILIAGGDGKGADMNELRPAASEKTKAVILMGKDAPLIEQALEDVVPLYHAGSMVEAVQIAAHFAKSGDTVLLSPACASLDQYKNYADRGNQFAAAVLALDEING